jgi:hypothetical protein
LDLFEPIWLEVLVRVGGIWWKGRKTARDLPNPARPRPNRLTVMYFNFYVLQSTRETKFSARKNMKFGNLRISGFSGPEWAIIFLLCRQNIVIGIDSYKQKHQL